MNTQRARLLGNIKTADGRVLCVFASDGITELVLATGKLVALDKHGAGKLAQIMSQAAAMNTVTNEHTLPGKPPP